MHTVSNVLRCYVAWHFSCRDKNK